MTKHRFIAEKLNFICQKKKETCNIFPRAAGMNENGSFVQVWMKSRAFCIKLSKKSSTRLVRQSFRQDFLQISSTKS